jgi:hypothetical protein
MRGEMEERGEREDRRERVERARAEMNVKKVR